MPGLKRKRTQKRFNPVKRRRTLKKTIKKVIRGCKEVNYFSQGPAVLTAAVTPVGPHAHLTTIASGAGASDRIGLELEPKSLQVKMMIRSTAVSAAQQRAVVRVVIAKMKQTQSDLPPEWLQIYLASSVMSHRDPRITQRFAVLYDKSFVLHSELDPIKMATFSHTWKPGTCSKIKWNGAASTDYERNQIFIWVVTDVGSTFPEVTYASMFKYTE